MMIETIEVFAWSFTAKPIMLAMLRDTAIKIARLAKYNTGFSGISALKASGAAMYKIMLIINRCISAVFIKMAADVVKGLVIKMLD